MRKFLGFSSFEFYFVVSVIGLIFIVAVQRYYKLAEETQRLGFEILAQNFSAAVYNYRAHWIIAQQSLNTSTQVRLDNKQVQFSVEGWPVAVNINELNVQRFSLAGCLSLWNNFLENPPLISYANSGPSGLAPYYLTVTSDNKCRYQWFSPGHQSLFFEYSSANGQVKSYTLPLAKND